MSSGVEDPDITIDNVEGSACEDTRDGLVGLTRIATVAKCTGVGQGKLLNALSRLDADPRCGPCNSEHPEAPGMNLARRRPRAVGPDTVEVTLVYEQQDVSATSTSLGQRVRMGAVVRQVETNKDATGAVVYVEYTYPTDTTDKNYPHNNPALAGKTVRKSPMFPKLAPEQSYQVLRKEASPPVEAIDEYVGKVCDGPFGHLQAAEAGQWLCMGITAEGPTSGPFDCSYEFGKHLNNWNEEESVFVDELKQAPPSNLVEGTGTKEVVKYVEADFTDLHLPGQPPVV